MLQPEPARPPMAEKTMTLAEVIDELSVTMPDSYVHKQKHNVDPNLSDKEILARYVLKAAYSLYSLDSDDQSNLERIAFNLDNAALTLNGVAQHLRQLRTQA